jgi:hypothetical protein
VTVAIWVCAALTIVSAGVSLGYAVAGFRAANGPERLPSSYALARSVALVVVAVIAPVTGSLAFIAAAAIGMICVQALDAIVGGMNRDRPKTVGPALTAAANSAALVWALVS